MTTTWPTAPTGSVWAEVDPLIGLVQPLVETEGRPGGVHQIRWEPEQSTRVAFDHHHGDVLVCEATQGAVQRSGLLQDPALRGAAAVLDPTQVVPRLEHLLRRPIRGCVTTPVSYRPGIPLCHPMRRRPADHPAHGVRQASRRRLQRLRGEPPRAGSRPWREGCCRPGTRGMLAGPRSRHHRRGAGDERIGAPV